MNPYSFSVLVFAICSMLLGFQVFLKREDKVGFLYFIVSALYAVWGVGFGLGISGGLGYGDSLFSLRLANVAAAFIPVVWLVFCSAYTNEPEQTIRRLSGFHILPALILLGSGSSLFIPFIRPSAGLAYYPYPSYLYHLEMTLYYVLVPVAFYKLIKSIRRLTGIEKSKRIGFVCVAMLGYFGGALSFVPVYGFDFPQHGLFLLPLYPFGLAYFMSSKGLFELENIAQAAHKDKLAALGILTASINHEIRAPLFVIRGAVETETDSSKIKERVLRQVDRLTGIVSRLTHFAKKGVEEEAKIEAIDLKEVLADIRPLFQHQLNYQSIEYTQDIPADLPKVMADRRYLEEILFNLILNSCQALKNTETPQIKLSACVFEDQRLPTTDQRTKRITKYDLRCTSSIVITIEDNGPGIPPDQLKNIFKPFHTTKQEGTGLGLYITKQLVEKCGGKIEAKAEQDNGAKFMVSLKGA